MANEKKQYADLGTLEAFSNQIKNLFATKTDLDALQAEVDDKVGSLSDLDVTATATELNYMDGITSNVQGQLDAKQPTITGGATTITSDNLTKNRALVSDGSGKVAVSAITSTELGYLDGVDSNVQDQLDSKVSKYGSTMTGNLEICNNNEQSPMLTISGTANESGVRASTYIIKSANSLSNGGTHITDEAFDGSTSTLVVNRNSGGLSNRITLQEMSSNYQITNYALYGEHNKPTPDDIGASPSGHEHSASKITSGILAVEQGGTGNSWGYVQAGAQEGSSVGAVATAEGRETIASGNYSHAEGNYAKATGLCAHAEGQTTKASGNMSHAQGESTEAKGKRSHAEGDHTIAGGEASHVQGKYNIEDTEEKYAHIVGNGDWKTRSNAHTLDWDGNGWFAGDVYVGGTSQDDTNASKLISEADYKWNLLYDSGEISAIANSISNIDVSGYTSIQVLVRCYNDGDSVGSRTGSAIFKAQNGKTYQFPVWSNMFSKSINTVFTMAQFKLVDGWLICPYASRLIGDANTFEDAEGGTAGNLSFTGSGMMKCTSPLSTLTISNLDQNANYYFGMGSRVMVWGWNA